MAGISEILVLIFLICLILIVPRMVKPASTKRRAPKPRFTLSAGMRTGIVLSALLPVVAALILKPWNGTNALILFIATGVLPVIVSWSLFWILSARKR